MKELLLISMFVYSYLQIDAQFQKATPPNAEKKEHWRVIHADSVLDNYYWMYDYFGKGPDSTKVVNYLKAENAYLDTVMGSSEKFRDHLFVEMKTRIKEQDEEIPWFKNGYYYYKRMEVGKQYFKLCRKKGNLEAKEEILLDVDKMASGHSYFSVSHFDISEDNKLLAYGVDKVSRREYTIYIKNLETGQIYQDSIINTDGSPCWANDNKTLFYTSKNEQTLLTEKIKRHTLGMNVNKDTVVYVEKDKSNYIGVYKSKNRNFIIIFSRATMSSEYRIINASNPFDEFKIFQPRFKNVLYSIIPLSDKFLILTNMNGAKNFKLMECPLNKTDTLNWKTMIPQRDDVLIEGVDEFKDYIVIRNRQNGLVKMTVLNLLNNSGFDIDFGEPSYIAYFSDNHEYNSSVFRYGYSSLTTPRSIYDYDLKTHEKKLLKRQEVIGGYDPADYVTERIYATAEDGTRIPISLVYKKGFIKNGNAPLLLSGYGSYGLSNDPNFDSNRLSLLNRGFVYAIAHIRGGQELGRKWYEDGKLMKKKNTFTDFIDCGKFLVNEKYTNRDHLYAIGGSAGGLLIGAILNMDPYLWHGVIAAVPFVDVVNTMLDENIPLTTNEFDEWGNPKNKEAYFYMKSYSPYENVEKKKYPSILVTTGLHDSQVQYFEPAKWVAKLRAEKTDQNILLLHTNMEFGHGGASGRFDYIKDVALYFAFILNLEKIYE